MMRRAMHGFVDLHSHVLPGIDDGPPDLPGALEMARAAAGAGTAVLAATPHLRADFPGVDVTEIAARCAALQAEIDGAGIPLRLVPGAEASLVWAIEASEDDLRRASYGGTGHDLLVETPSDVSMIEQLLYQVHLRGLRVTLAHPERSAAFRREPARLERLVEQGVLLEVNADALLARKRSSIRDLAERLCRDGLAHVLASDGHRARDRRPVTVLAAGAEALESLVGADRAHWMCVDAPAAILAGRPLPAAPEPAPPRSGFWRRRR